MPCQKERLFTFVKKNRMKKLLLLLLCLPLLFTTCKKEEWTPQNTVKGYIEYFDWNPLVLDYKSANNTEVYLKTTSDSLVKQTTTTNAGRFSFDFVKNEEYYIYAYRESNTTNWTYSGNSDNFLVDGFTVNLDTLTLKRD